MFPDSGFVVYQEKQVSCLMVLDDSKQMTLLYKRSKQILEALFSVSAAGCDDLESCPGTVQYCT